MCDSGSSNVCAINPGPFGRGATLFYSGSSHRQSWERIVPPAASSTQSPEESPSLCVGTSIPCSRKCASAKIRATTSSSIPSSAAHAWRT
jgi:hypothetical protein